jgi:hypothetical protein
MDSIIYVYFKKCSTIHHRQFLLLGVARRKNKFSDLDRKRLMLFSGILFGFILLLSSQLASQEEAR